VSVRTGDGLDQLRSHLRNSTTAVLLGPSGSGKTSLVNQLLGDGQLATGPVRSADHRGRHTTTRRELVLLPGGGCVIDTPGVRELGLWLDTEAVDGAFADVMALAGACRFRDCQHLDEPGCAVLAAVNAGELDGRRLESWHKLRREAQVLAARVDDAERRRSKQRDRQLAKLIREVGRLKSNR
jgi:ribosome biogenesis GTPase